MKNEITYSEAIFLATKALMQKNKDVYVYLDTPGGSIQSGNKILMEIQIIKALQEQITKMLIHISLNYQILPSLNHRAQVIFSHLLLKLKLEVETIIE